MLCSYWFYDVHSERKTCKKKNFRFYELELPLNWMCETIFMGRRENLIKNRWHFMWKLMKLSICERSFCLGCKINTKTVACFSWILIKLDFNGKGGFFSKVQFIYVLIWFIKFYLRKRRLWLKVASEGGHTLEIKFRE